MDQTVNLGQPAESEYGEYFGLYIKRVSGSNILDELDSQIREFRSVLDSIDENTADQIHEPYSWTIKEVVGHTIDVERIFGYRALRFAVGDRTPLPGFEQNPYVDNVDYGLTTLAHLVDELELLRRSNLCFFRRISADAWNNRGVADNTELSVRAIAYILAGHVIHHLAIIKKRTGK